MSRLSDQTRAELVDVVGGPHVLTDAQVVDGYTYDWTRRFHGSSCAVVRPQSADQVAAVLAICRGAGLAVTPQGGNTGLVAGGVAFDGAITLSLTGLVGIDDGRDATLIAAAGTPLAAVQARAAARGYQLPVDLAARDSATIGGMVATNAGGLHVMRWGPMRSQLLGIEAATTNGALIHDMRGLVKDNTGLHWPSILCGSEGVLAVITSAKLRLVPRPAENAVALLSFASVADALQALSELKSESTELSALELITKPCFDLVIDRLGLTRPFSAPVAESSVIVLAEASGDAGVALRLADHLAQLRALGEAVLADDAAGVRRLWAYRDRVTEAIALVGPAHKLDVTLPHDALRAFIDEIGPLIGGRRAGAQVWLFGHAGDGNIHVNITGVAIDDAALDRWVLEEVAARGGSISAEHGIGRLKREHLDLNRSAWEIELMHRLKRAFDPEGILNPGVLL